VGCHPGLSQPAEWCRRNHNHPWHELHPQRPCATNMMTHVGCHPGLSQPAEWRRRNHNHPWHELHPQRPCATNMMTYSVEKRNCCCHSSMALWCRRAAHAHLIQRMCGDRSAYLASANSIKAKGGGRGGILMSMALMAPNCRHTRRVSQPPQRSFQQSRL
jgi:hypothetical protein